VKTREKARQKKKKKKKLRKTHVGTVNLPSFPKVVKESKTNISYYSNEFKFFEVKLLLSEFYFKNGQS